MTLQPLGQGQRCSRGAVIHPDQNRGTFMLCLELLHASACVLFSPRQVVSDNSCLLGTSRSTAISPRPGRNRRGDAINISYTAVINTSPQEGWSLRERQRAPGEKPGQPAGLIPGSTVELVTQFIETGSVSCTVRLQNQTSARVCVGGGWMRWEGIMYLGTAVMLIPGSLRQIRPRM